MSCEKLWQSPALYSTQVLPSDSPSYAAGLQCKQRSVGTSPLLRPGFFLKLALLALLAVFFPGAGCTRRPARLRVLWLIRRALRFPELMSRSSTRQQAPLRVIRQPTQAAHSVR